MSRIDEDVVRWPILESFAAYQAYLHEHREESERRSRVELSSLRSPDGAFELPGFCQPCGKAVDFHVDYRYSYEVDGRRLPNWRESCICPSCGLNNRMRAALHFFQDLFQGRRELELFITEQNTPISTRLQRDYARVVESEFLGDEVPLGQHDEQGRRNEDLTALTFADQEFDAILSFDVLEHVPNTPKAVRECLRVLKPGGWFFFTVPFLPDHEKTLTRARLLPSGEIEHLLEPEYHYDPVRPEGCLAFYHFGWEILEDLRGAGFEEANAHLVWSDAFGYLGQQVLLTARRGS